MAISGILNKERSRVERKLVEEKKRNKNNRLWIIMFVLIFALPTVVNAGYGVVGYLFYRLQYNISTETYSDLISAWFVVNMFAQLVTVPFLSNKLGLQDTTIILLAIGPAVLGFFAEAWRTEVRHDIFFFLSLSCDLRFGLSSSSGS